MHKVVDYIDFEIDEGIPINGIQISSVKPNIEDTIEVEEE